MVVHDGSEMSYVSPDSRKQKETQERTDVHQETSEIHGYVKVQDS
jgi:hypothetical protein